LLLKVSMNDHKKLNKVLNYLLTN